MTQQWKDATGIYGNWNARLTWKDGTIEELPCAHAYFVRGGRGVMTYHDPLDWDEDGGPRGPERALASRKMQDWVELARRLGRVILTSDYVNEDGNPSIPFTRRGYIGVYDIADLTFDAATGLQFKFTRRYPRATDAPVPSKGNCQHGSDEQMFAAK
jgi:hypothetical protein